MKYDVWEGKNKILFLDVQAELLDSLKTKIVVPLIPYDEAKVHAKRLNPIFVIGENRYIMATHYIAAIPKTELSVFITNLSHLHDEIVRALDMAFQGF